MNMLNIIHNEILDVLLKGRLTSAETATLEAAIKGIQAFLALPHDETTGQKAQSLADGLLTMLTPLLPALGPYAAVLALLEANVGRAVDWICNEIKMSKLKITDNQTGPVVHDDGAAAPMV